MSRKNIAKPLSENFNRNLCLEVAYYNNEASRIVEKNFNSCRWENITYEQVHALQSLLVSNAEKFDYIVTVVSGEYKFFLTNDTTWKRNDYERVTVKSAIKILSQLLDMKKELDLASSYKEAKYIEYRMQNLISYRDNYQNQMKSFFDRAISYVEELTAGLRSSTKLSVFENYLAVGNSYYEDSYEEAKSHLERTESEITSVTLESALNPLIKENFEVDEEKFQALRTLMSNA